jgi:hypothetical protein
MYLYEKNGGGGNDGQLICVSYISRTFLETRQSDEVSELSIKVTKLRKLKRSNKVTKVGTTRPIPRIFISPTLHPSSNPGLHIIREFAVEPPDQLVANLSQELPVLGG